MGEKGSHSRFNGAAWFDRQVRSRTRAALDERGSTAKPHSREYQREYARQLSLFRAERAEIKQRRLEKHLARLEKKAAAGTCGG